MAGITGQIISMANAIGSNAIGSDVYLHTRHMYYAIETRSSWGSTVYLTPLLKGELHFWDNNDRLTNGRKLFEEPQKFDTMAYSDASGQGYGGYVVSDKQNLVCQGHWTENEKAKSSTWRELKAVSNMLLAIGNKLQGHRVQWYTDNQNVVRIIERGSRKPEIQSTVEEVIQLCAKHSALIKPVWIPREENEKADYLSKLIDVDDWGIHTNIYNWISNMWGPFTVDRFATCYNTKCERFNSRFWNPGCEGIDAYAINWQGKIIGWSPHPVKSCEHGDTFTFVKPGGQW
jgi:hypothetical protein